MYVGQYKHSLDDRGRISLPKKIRILIDSNEIVLIKGFESCIFGYEKNVWQRQSLGEIASPITDKKSRDLRRYLFSGAEAVEIDKIGRILLPVVLKEYAKITNNVYVIGAGDHFEIWDEQNWSGYLARLETNDE